MSIIVQSKQGHIILFSKGADEVIFPLIRSQEIPCGIGKVKGNKSS